MPKLTYENYTTGIVNISVQEKFGNANVYTKSSQSILNKATGFINAYDFTINPYSGCQYGCSYCYAAAFSPNSKMRQDWGNWVIIKDNAVQLLQKELTKWERNNPEKQPRIYMSSVTDPYQPLESRQKLTRNLLEVMIPYRPQLVIQTRSPIITRDIDLLQRFKHLRINISIPTGSEQVRKDFEPQSPSIQARINALQKIKQSIIPLQGYVPKLSITITPLLPTLYSEQENFIQKLAICDRIVIQSFHQSHRQSLTASTRPEALELKQKYAWWYDQESENYHNFKEKLIQLLPHIEIMEGKEGFAYE